MKRLIFLMPVLFLFEMTVFPAAAQEFRRGHSILVSPSQVIPDQYVSIRLPVSPGGVQAAGVFDVNNPYTWLEIVYDSKQRVYHVLYQTDFVGKPTFVAYSSNLTVTFSRKDKPMFLFQSCLRGLAGLFSPVQATDLLMTCIIDRLNYCSGP